MTSIFSAATSSMRRMLPRHATVAAPDLIGASEKVAPKEKLSSGSKSTPIDAHKTVASTPVDAYVHPFARSGQDDAQALLAWLGARGVGNGWIPARLLMQLYVEMCAERGWRAQGWNPIGRALAILTCNGKKLYRDVGSGQRVRVYPLPPA
ncbi:MAG: hypothetical protein NW223_23900 [Hyphomicrobiaceae bacterium]|nr:hypothetical protein [Hyphomicrobiaceae bacterium]